MKIQKLKESLCSLQLKTMAEILEETLKKGQQENLSAADLLLILTLRKWQAGNRDESKPASPKLTSR
jgi:hypothetical protein